MTDHLKTLADASLHVEAAEQALDAGEPTGAEAALDDADAVLAELRERWPEMSTGQRTLVGTAAKRVRSRADAARARLPKRRALSEGAPEADPEQELAPDDAA